MHQPLYSVEKEKRKMKYTYCETLMWHAMTPAMFRYLAQREPCHHIPRTNGNVVGGIPDGKKFKAIKAARNCS